MKRQGTEPARHDPVLVHARALEAMGHDPEDRSAARGALTHAAGGRPISLYYHWGEYDGMVVVEAPDEISVNVIAPGASSGGPVRISKTTRLFPATEIVAAMARAAKLPCAPSARPASGNRGRPVQ